MNFKILTLSIITSTYLFSESSMIVGFGEPVTFGTQINSLQKEKEKVVKQREFAIEENYLLKHKQIMSFILSGDIKKAQFESDLYFNDITTLRKTGLELAVSLITMGEVSKAFGEYKIAMKYHEKAFTELSNIKKEHPIDYALASKYIIDTMILNDLSKEAEKYNIEADKIIQSNFNKRDVLNADIELNDAKIKFSIDNMKVGYESLKNAAEIYKLVYGSNSYEGVLVELEKAKSLLTTDSNACLNQINIVENLFDKNIKPKYEKSLIYGEILILRGKAYIYDAKFENAITEYNKALDFYSTVFGNDNEKIAEIISNKAMAEKSISLNKESIEDYKKATDIFINKKGEKAPELVDIYQSLGNIYLSLNEFDLAISYTQKALDINVYNYGNYHTTTKIIKSNLDFLQKEKVNDLQQNPK